IQVGRRIPESARGRQWRASRRRAPAEGRPSGTPARAWTLGPRAAGPARTLHRSPRPARAGARVPGLQPVSQKVHVLVAHVPERLWIVELYVPLPTPEAICPVTT